MAVSFDDKLLTIFRSCIGYTHTVNLSKKYLNMFLSFNLFICKVVDMKKKGKMKFYFLKEDYLVSKKEKDRVNISWMIKNSQSLMLHKQRQFVRILSEKTFFEIEKLFTSVVCLYKVFVVNVFAAFIKNWNHFTRNKSHIHSYTTRNTNIFIFLNVEQVLGNKFAIRFQGPKVLIHSTQKSDIQKYFLV